LVKPERDQNRERSSKEFWWRFARTRPELYRAIETLDHVLALSRHGNTTIPVRVPTGRVYSEAAIVFAFDGFADLAILSSVAHTAWTLRYASTMRTDLRYTPSDVFLTLPRPQLTAELEDLGLRLDSERRALMLDRAWGLTTTYNHVHSPAERDPEVVALRDLHTAIDQSVMDAYGWDVDLEIGHHSTKIGTRWTVSLRARFELLDLLLKENHRRAALVSP